MSAMPAKTIADQTLAASALSRLRSDIIACRLMPNERLRFEALRERYGMGVSPLREALMRLEAEGLVQLEQNKGFRVSEVSHENLVDLMQTRIEIEIDCAALVAGERRRRLGGRSCWGRFIVYLGRPRSIQAIRKPSTKPGAASTRRFMPLSFPRAVRRR